MLVNSGTVLTGLALVPSAWGASLIASHFSGKVYTLDFQEASGQLSVVAETGGCGTIPGWIQLYSEDKALYCFDESWFGSGTIAKYNVGSDGRLTVASQFRTTGNDVHGTLYGGSNGKGFVATAQYSPSTITTYAANGSRLQLEKFTLAAPGPHPRQDVPHPHEVAVDPTGEYILVPDLGADLVRIFKINTSTGRLTSCGNGKANPGDGPRHATWWNNTILYTLNELGNSVSTWAADYGSDCISLTLLDTISTYADGTSIGPSTKAAEIRVVDNFLYASNRADQTFGSAQDSLAIYTIDPETGSLSWLEATNAHAYYPRTFQINKEGTLVAVGGQTSSNVAIISRDVATGKLGDLIASVQVGSAGRPGEEDGLSGVVWNE